MRILIVGAGAVGVVYGRHLQRGGAEVSFLVRPKYAEACRRGMDVFPLNEGRDAPAQRFEGYGVLTELDEVRAQRWDQLWLCIPSTALSGDWLAPTLEAVGDATVVGMQPGADDRAKVLAHCSESRLVWSLITMLSYTAPLPGEQRGAGIAYWFPPLSSSPFDGPKALAREVVVALKVGGCPAVYSPAMVARAGIGGAAFIPMIAALEQAGWSFKSLRSHAILDTATEAAREAMAVVAVHEGLRTPALRHAVRPWLLKIVMAMAPKVAPLPLEDFLSYHFTKVGEQTRQMLAEYESIGADHSLPTARIHALRERLLEAPGQDA